MGSSTLGFPLMNDKAIALHRRARALRRAADRLEYRETLFDLEEAS